VRLPAEAKSWPRIPDSMIARETRNITCVGRFGEELKRFAQGAERIILNETGVKS
jgi:hypothetical protein